MSVQALQAYALAHYDEGGHWIYETYTDEEYNCVLVEANGNLANAKAALREEWTLLNDYEQDCAFE